MTETQYRELMLKGICENGICEAALLQAKTEREQAHERHRSAQIAFKQAGERLANLKNRYAALNEAAKQAAADHLKVRREAAEAMVEERPVDPRQTLIHLKGQHEVVSDAAEFCLVYSIPDARRAEMVAEIELAKARLGHNEAIASVLGIESWLLLAPALANDPGLKLETGDTAADNHFKACQRFRDDAKELEAKLRAHDEKTANLRTGARI